MYNVYLNIQDVFIYFGNAFASEIADPGNGSKVKILCTGKLHGGNFVNIIHNILFQINK